MVVVVDAFPSSMQSQARGATTNVNSLTVKLDQGIQVSSSHSPVHGAVERTALIGNETSFFMSQLLASDSELCYLSR